MHWPLSIYNQQIVLNLLEGKGHNIIRATPSFQSSKALASCLETPRPSIPNSTTSPAFK